MFDSEDQRSADPAVWLQQRGRQFSERMSLMPDWLAGFVVKEISPVIVCFSAGFSGFHAVFSVCMVPLPCLQVVGSVEFFSQERPGLGWRNGGGRLFCGMTRESGDIHGFAGENDGLTTVSDRVRAVAVCVVQGESGEVCDESFCGVGTEEPGECEASGGADASSDAG